MATTSSQATSGTTTDTKRVFLRAERGDKLRVLDEIEVLTDIEYPSEFTVVQRQMTYYGPRLRVESEDEQYLLTSPGPDSQAMLWVHRDFDWRQALEVTLEFTGELPQYEICPACGETVSTMAHERRAILGTCDK